MKTSWRTFAALVLASLLLAACGQQGNTEIEVQDTATYTAEPTATSTNTPIPSPTAIVVEYPSPDQTWLLEEIFPKVRDVGCEPTYEVSYYPEYANSIAWTVDGAGNTVQGITALNFCGVSGQGPYIAFYKISDGWETTYNGWQTGPFYQVEPEFVSDPQYAEYEGFLNVEDLNAMQSLAICVRSGIARANGAPADYVSVHKPTVFVSSTQAVAEAFDEGWYPDDVEGISGIFAQCDQ